jgi:hypothetical protein
MPNNTCTGAMMACTFGAAPSSFIATPKQVMTSFMPAANIMDNKPMANIPPFGVCTSLANPAVAAATAAALGVLTPQPCIPNTPAPWAPGSPTVMVANMPALNNTSKLMCLWAGVISFTSPGQTTHQIP